MINNISVIDDIKGVVDVIDIHDEGESAVAILMLATLAGALELARDNLWRNV